MLRSRPNVNFDKATHVYTDRDSGEVVPSVTTLLKRAGYVTNFYKGTEARDLGDEIHELSVLVDKNRMIPQGSCKKVDDCLAQYAKFLEDCDAVRVRSESLVHCKSLNYAGTLDGEWAIGVGPYNGAVLVGDIKTGSTVPSWCCLQTAAYDMADGGLIIRKPRTRFALHLTPDKYKIKVYDKINDYHIFAQIAKDFGGY